MRKLRAADLSTSAAEKRRVVRRGSPAARGRQISAEAAPVASSYTPAADWDLILMAVR